MRPLRATRAPAPDAALPAAPVRVIYSGRRHGWVRLAECRWEPGDGVEAGAYLDRWICPARRAVLCRRGIGAILTCIDRNGRWHPMTLVTESVAVPGQLGLFLASAHLGGDLVGVVHDAAYLGRFRPGSSAAQAAVAAAGGKHATRLFWLGSHLYNGGWCRPGGPMAANDPASTGFAANAIFYDHGGVNLKPGAEVPPLSADCPDHRRGSSEVLFEYGTAYWQDAMASPSVANPTRARKSRRLA